VGLILVGGFLIGFYELIFDDFIFFCGGGGFMVVRMVCAFESDCSLVLCGVVFDICLGGFILGWFRCKVLCVLSGVC